MSYVSTCAKLNIRTRRFGPKRKVSKPIDRSYSNFAGSNVPILTKESFKKALPDKYKHVSAW